MLQNKLQIHPTRQNICIKIAQNQSPGQKTTHAWVLTWMEGLLGKNIDNICAKVGAGIGIMRRIKPFVPVETLKLIYNALVQPYFDYCSPLWDNCGSGLREKLQRLQNRAATVITGSTFDIRSVDVLNMLGWESLDQCSRVEIDYY